MAEFDSAVQLPKIFSNNRLSVLPVSRSSRVIGRFDTYFDFPERFSEEETYSELPEFYFKHTRKFNTNSTFEKKKSKLS